MSIGGVSELVAIRGKLLEALDGDRIEIPRERGVLGEHNRALRHKAIYKRLFTHCW